MSEVWHRDVNGADQSLLLALADWADDDGSSIYPSIRRIAWKTGISVSAIKRRMSRLRQLGVLLVVSKGGGKFKTTEYALNLAILPAKKPFTYAAE